MSDQDLASDEGLRAVCESVSRDRRLSGWILDLAKTIRRVRAANASERGTREFQQWLWEDNHVAGVGQGTVPVQRALDDARFRQWLAVRSMEPLPASAEDRLLLLTALYEDVKKQLEPLLDRRTPHLKIFRVIAALYPEAMTSIASTARLKELVRRMGGRHLDPVERHFWVRKRLGDLLGNVGSEASVLAERISLPWLLYERVARISIEPTQWK